MRLFVILLLGLCTSSAEEIRIGKDAFPTCDTITGPCPLRDGQAFWYQRDNERLGYETYGINGKITEQRSFKGDRLDGTQFSWHENGMLKHKKQYTNDVLHGEWVEFDESGTVIGRSVFDLGTGTRSTFYPDGKPMAIQNFKDGYEDGVWLEYYPSGKLKDKARKQRGKQIGKSISLNEDGTINAYALYNDRGNCEFIAYIDFVKNGQIVRLSVYQNDTRIWTSNENSPPPSEWSTAASDLNAFFSTLTIDD